MTVRAWVTISIIVLLLLSAAVAVRVLQPLRPPELVASVGSVRLEGVSRGSCWTQRGGERRCEKGSRVRYERGPQIPREAVLRIVAAYPVQPKDGVLRIEDASTRAPVRETPWTDELPYELQPGAYVLHADARYTDRDYVRFDFAFRVR